MNTTNANGVQIEFSTAAFGRCPVMAFFTTLEQAQLFIRGNGHEVHRYRRANKTGFTVTPINNWMPWENGIR